MRFDIQVHLDVVSINRSKQHREFFHVPLEGWQQVPGFEGLIDELVLADNLDPETRTGSRTRLARWQPGTLLPEPVKHDYREEILVLEGDLVVGCGSDGNGGEVFEAYSFATRPAEIWHGPFTTRTGCLQFELDIYE